MLSSLARLADDRPRQIGAVAVGFFLLAAILGGGVAQRLDPYSAEDPATESIKAKDELQAAGLRVPAVIVVVRGAPGAASARARLADIERELRGHRQVRAVTGFHDTESPLFVSHDRQSTYLAVSLRPTDDKQWQQAGANVARSLDGRPGIVVGGPAVALAQINEQIEKDLQKAELLVFPLLLLLLFVFFRSMVAALLPLMVGALAIVGTFLILRLASELASISIFALNLTTALGLGLAIDYSLFVVSRYREEIAKDGPGLSAMQRTMATAGRTVFFSALTIALVLAALLLFPQRFLYSMGLGGSLVTLFAALISLTVLPAALTLLGSRVNALAPHFLRRRAESDARPEEEGFWYRLTGFVMGHPRLIASGTAALLIALGIPFLDIRFNASDPSDLPRSASARQVHDALQAEFPPHRDTPIWLSVKGSESQLARKVSARVREVSGVSEVRAPKNLNDGVRAVEVISATPFRSESSQETVRQIRDIRAPPGATLLVGGATAEFIDFQASLIRHGPLVLALIVSSSLVVLFLMTGSVVLPVKSLLMNLLNLSAVFGLLVLIFQDGRLEGILDYTSSHAIEQTMPILIFAVGFGISTDYTVFLLSRIKEAYDQGVSNADAVVIGLERSGRIVSAAAVILAVALGAFATSQVVFVKANGLGVALAVLIDASIIRALLVPSLMAMLGQWNWWAPASLRRLHRRFGLGEAASAETVSERAT